MQPQTPSKPTGGSSVAVDLAEQGHNDLVGQPHEQAAEGPVAEAEAVAAEISTEQQPMGTPGRPFNRKSPFFIGMTAAAGFAVTYGIISQLSLAANVLILTAYFLADMPRICALIYRMVPHTRRPRAILIGDDILAKVGTYVLGNLLISLIAGALTFGWLMIFSIPYAALLSIMVALFDLVPVVGSSIAGIIVAAALTISLPLCLATIAFCIIYRTAEDYLLVPRIIGRAVKVPALVTVVAVLSGGALLGIIGALVAIPAAAALLLISREVLIPRMVEA